MENAEVVYSRQNLRELGQVHCLYLMRQMSQDVKTIHGVH